MVHVSWLLLEKEPYYLVRVFAGTWYYLVHVHVVADGSAKFLTLN